MTESQILAKSSPSLFKLNRLRRVPKMVSTNCLARSGRFQRIFDLFSTPDLKGNISLVFLYERKSSIKHFFHSLSCIHQNLILG